jgi:surface protein
MGRIKYKGEYILPYGTHSIFRKYSQNGRIPSNATIVGDTPPPFGYKFPDTSFHTIALGGTFITYIQGELVTAVDMWVNPATQDKAVKKYGDIQHWDVSEVKIMHQLFNRNRHFASTVNPATITAIRTGLKNFNGNIENWNVSKVTTMTGMFRNTLNFNRNINNWDVSTVSEMGEMFQDATAFNQVLDKWDISQVNSMSSIFKDATAFITNGNNTYSKGVAKWRPVTNSVTTNMFQSTATPSLLYAAPWSGLISPSNFLTTNGTPGTGFFYN